MNKPVVLTGLRANSEFHIGNYLGGILPVVALQNRHAGKYQVNMFVPDLHSFTTPIDHSKLYQQTLDNLRIFVAAGLDINNSDTFIYRQSFISAHSELQWILSCFTGFDELNRMTQFKDKSQGLLNERSVNRLLSPIASFEKDRLTIDEAERIIKIYRRLEAATTNLDQHDKGTIEKLKRHELDLVATEAHSLIRAYQDRVGLLEGKLSVSTGLFNYPVLMAADILLYDAKFIPVGDDQKQHIELARDLAMRLNNKFEKNLFTPPEPWTKQLEFMNLEAGARVRSLRNPEKKMSKSVSDPSGTIMLSDNPAEAAKKIMRAETDSFGEIRYDFKERPGISNLLQMLALLTSRAQSEVNAQWEGQTRYGDLKKAVAEAVETFLNDLQQKIQAVEESVLLAKLEQDEAAMNKVANAKLYEVQKAVGLRK